MASENAAKIKANDTGTYPHFEVSKLPKKAKMLFKEDKFYGDMKSPKYLKGQVYEIEGQDMIARWLKRGATLVVDAPKVETPAAPAKAVEPAKNK